MLEMRGLMGGFYRISEWIMRLAVTNVLWVVCSIPVFLLLFFLFVTPDLTPELLVQTLIFIAVLSPFTLVPATAAVFVNARKWVTGDADVPLLKTFFRGYKENYKQSMIGGILFSVLGVVLYVNYRFYSGQAGSLKALSLLFIALSIFVFAAFLNYLCLMVHFHMKTLKMAKNSFLFAVARPVSSIVTVLANGAILYFSMRFTFLVPFFMGSLMAVVTFWQFNRGFHAIQAKQEKWESDSQTDGNLADRPEPDGSGIEPEQENAGASAKVDALPDKHSAGNV